jgi:hypothetical protein
MASVAQGLKVIQIERSTALVDGDDVVHHVSRAQHTMFLALLAERILLKLECSQAPPSPALVEVGIVMSESRERFFLRKPRALCVFLYHWHG